MTCAELEILAADYVDGTLPATARTELEAHLTGCSACAQFVQDIRGFTAFLEAVPEAEPPSELVTRILRQIPRSNSGGSPSWWRRLWSGWGSGVLQPRFVMGIAMTILSVSMLARLAGAGTQGLKRAALEPVRLWQALDDRGYRIWDRTVKYCDNMPLVTGLESRWSEWSEQSQDEGNGR